MNQNSFSNSIAFTIIIGSDSLADMGMEGEFRFGFKRRRFDDNVECFLLDVVN
jgi:hypothetical protein